MKRSGNKAGGRGRTAKPGGRTSSKTGGRTGSKSGGRPAGRGASTSRRRDSESRDGGSSTGDRKPRFGEEKPAFRPRSSGSSERKFSGGEKRSYSSDRRKEGSDSREGTDRRKKFDADKPQFRRTGERSEFGGEKRSYSSDRRKESGERSESSDRRKKFDGEKPPFRKSTGERSEFRGEKRSYSSDRRKESGERNESSDRRKKFDGEKPPFRRTGERPASGGEKRGYGSDRREEGSHRDDDRGKKFGDKPFRRSSGERSEVGKKFSSERRVKDVENTEHAPKRRTKADNEKAAFKSRSTEGPRKRVDKGEKAEYENEKGYNNKARLIGRAKSTDSNNKNEFNADRPDFHSSGEIDQTRTFSENKPAKTDFKDKRSNDRGTKGGDKDDRPWNRKEKHEFYGDKKKGKTKSFSSSFDDGSTRLNKYIANAGVCSRREADELIAAGVVSVNGQVVTEMGYKVMPGDVVKYNNEALKSERLVYILLNKPKDFITTTDDPENRKTVMGLIEKACKERVYPVGRLDRNTTGVLLFTNDGDLAKKLTHPSFEVHKVYQAELDRAVKVSDIEKIREGIRLEDGLIKADEVVYTNTDKDVVGMELHSGKNRIVRRIFEHLGYEVKKLDRVIFAGMTKKDLPRGRWRFLTEMEVASLKMMTGKKATVK